MTESRRIRGSVARWGTRGYGFIMSAELPREAWCHVRFITDSGIDVLRPLPIGMELEFEPREVEGGRIQALSVTRPGFRATTASDSAEPIRGPIRGLDQLAALTAISPAAPTETATPPEPQLLRDVGLPDLANRVLAEKRRLEGERTRLEADAQRLFRRAEGAEAQIPDVARDFDDRIADLQAERDRQLADLRTSAAKHRADAESIRKRRDALPLGSQEAVRILAEHLASARADLLAWIRERESERGELLAARRAAVNAVGAQAVSEYEEIRKRRTAAVDAVEAKAYALAESTVRPSLKDYAAALDNSRGPEPGRFTVVVAAPEDTEGRLILCAPLATGDIEGEDDLLWRAGAFLFDAAEWAAGEMNAAVAVGAVAGSLAVELRPWGAEPELVEIALREAWDARPSLSEKLSLAWELIPGLDPLFQPTDLEQEEDERAPGPAAGGTVREVSLRLGLPLADLVAGLRGSGLPFPDDAMDVDVERSLRTLLHLSAVDDSPAPAPPNPATVAEEPPDKSSPVMIARRLLLKLMRDRRIGGRYTRVDNVWGHHFADDEKDLAREVTDRLIRRGLLLLNPRSGDQVSIDPRRVGEVQSIVDLRLNDPSLFEGLQ